MEISQLTLKLIILLIPGAIASIIFEKLTIHKKWDAFKFIAHCILLGGLSYLLADVICGMPIRDPDFEKFWLNLQEAIIPISVVIKSLFAAILVGFITSALDNYKVVNRLGKFFKFSTKYGDENLYSYFLTSPEVNEIFLHDIANNITYHGMIDSYSETDEFKEIVLRDVKVYVYDTATLAYEINRIYLSRPKDSIIIEVPA